MKTLILDIKFNDKYFERAIHHEIFHLIKDSNKNFLMNQFGQNLMMRISIMQNVQLVQIN